MKLTSWTDETKITIEEIEEKLVQPHADEYSEHSTGYNHWEITKQYDEDRQGFFNGKKVRYNLFNFSVEQIPAGAAIDDDSVTKKTGFIIVYAVSDKVRYIINRSSDALTLLRKMLFYTGKNEIKKNNLLFTADVFVWLISKVYNGENVLEGSNNYLENIAIDIIRGFKGDTEDSLTTISAVGESVMNIISTLSFLIESKNLNQIIIGLSYKRHTNLEIKLNNKSTVEFYEKEYAGELLQDYIFDSVRGEIILTLYMEVLPIIIQNYQSDIDAHLWSQEKCIHFLTQVAEDLDIRVKNRINDLKERPEQLMLNLFEE